MEQKIKSVLWWLLVEFISLLPPKRLRYPSWKALESVTPNLRPRRRLLKHSQGLIDRDTDEEALSFQMMDSDGRYLLVQSIETGLPAFVFSLAKMCFLAFGVVGCVAAMLTDNDTIQGAYWFYYGMLIYGGAIAFGMRALGVKTINPVAAFDRYTGHVYFPGGFLRRSLTCQARTYKQRDKEWAEQRERKLRQWQREDDGFFERARARRKKLSDEQQPDMGN